MQIILSKEGSDFFSIWNTDKKSGAFTFKRFEPDSTVIFFYDIFANRQSDTGAFKQAFFVELLKKYEYFAGKFFFYPDTVVFYAQ